MRRVRGAGVSSGTRIPRGVFRLPLRGRDCGARLSASIQPTRRAVAGDHRGRGSGDRVDIGVVGGIDPVGRTGRNRHTETRSPAMASTPSAPSVSPGNFHSGSAGTFPPRSRTSIPRSTHSPNTWPVRQRRCQRITRRNQTNVIANTT